MLSKPLLDWLDVQPGQAVLDCTIGLGGHAAMLLPRLEGGIYVGFDLDADNLSAARRRLEPLAAL